MPLPKKPGAVDACWQKILQRRQQQQSNSSSSSSFNSSLPSSDPDAQIESESIVYQRGEMIGCGSFGKVYKAIDIRTGEMIAVKQIFLDPKVNRSQVQKELVLLTHLKHANIVRLLGHTVKGTTLNILMEYVSGNSLSDLINKMKRLHESVVRQYVSQILHALHYCHSMGVIHRDIKCANVLVTPEGRMKLADFGSARIVEHHSAGEYTAVSNMTPSHVAPEVCSRPDTSNTNDSSHQSNDASVKYNFKVDIWALGCMMVEMLTAQGPWADHQFQNVWQCLFHISQPHAIPPIPTYVSDEAKDFLRWCFTRDPELRPSAEQLLEHPFIINANAFAAAAQMHEDDTSKVTKVPAIERNSSEMMINGDHGTAGGERRVASNNYNCEKNNDSDNQTSGMHMTGKVISTPPSSPSSSSSSLRNAPPLSSIPLPTDIVSSSLSTSFVNAATARIVNDGNMLTIAPLSASPVHSSVASSSSSSSLFASPPPPPPPSLSSSSSFSHNIENNDDDDERQKNNKTEALFSNYASTSTATATTPISATTMTTLTPTVSPSSEVPFQQLQLSGV